MSIKKMFSNDHFPWKHVPISPSSFCFTLTIASQAKPTGQEKTAKRVSVEAEKNVIRASWKLLGNFQDLRLKKNICLQK